MNTSSAATRHSIDRDASTRRRTIGVMELFARCGSLPLAEQLYDFAHSSVNGRNHRTVVFLLSRGLPADALPDSADAPVRRAMTRFATRAQPATLAACGSGSAEACQLIWTAAQQELQGNSRRAAVLYTRAATHVHAAPRQLTWQYTNLGMLADSGNRYTAALHWYAQAARCAAPIADRDLDISIELNVAVTRLGLGDSDPANTLWFRCVRQLVALHGADHPLVSDLARAAEIYPATAAHSAC